MKNVRYEITEELHKDFKSTCAKDGKGMKQVIIELMKFYIDSKNDLTKNIPSV